MVKKGLMLLLLGWQFITPSLAQIDKSRLDSFFNILADNNEAMGSVTISKNGRKVYERAIGYSYVNDGEKIPATPKTRYRIASITKMYTATMIYQLIEEKKLSLTTKLNTYFPEVPNAKIISIGELLCHRSGLHNFIGTRTWKLGAKSEDELLAMIALSKPDFKPDSMTQYSNTNYWLLGFIIERICQMSYGDALQQRIARKLGLRDTYYGYKTDVKNNESYSYAFNGAGWDQFPETDVSLLGGAGGILSTTEDETKFIEGLFGGRLINETSIAELTTLNEKQGMGISKIPFHYHNGLGHTGHIDGFYSVLVYFPEDGLTVAYCSNGHVYGLNNILIGILSCCFDSPFTIPDFKAIANYNISRLDQYTGTYSCSKTPIKITITTKGTNLIAQATEQDSFPLHTIGRDKFRYDLSDIEMEFNTDTHVMVHKQDGLTFIFRREH